MASTSGSQTSSSGAGAWWATARLASMRRGGPAAQIVWRQIQPNQVGPGGTPASHRVLEPSSSVTRLNNSPRLF
jgi:hypothetical protein